MFKNYGGNKLALHVNEVYKTGYRRNQPFLSNSEQRINEDIVFRFSSSVDKVQFVLHTEMKYVFLNKNSAVLHTAKLVSVAS